MRCGVLQPCEGAQGRKDRQPAITGSPGKNSFTQHGADRVGGPAVADACPFPLPFREGTFPILRLPLAARCVALIHDTPRNRGLRACLPVRGMASGFGCLSPDEAGATQRGAGGSACVPSDPGHPTSACRTCGSRPHPRPRGNRSSGTSPSRRPPTRTHSPKPPPPGPCSPSSCSEGTPNPTPFLRIRR